MRSFRSRVLHAIVALLTVWCLGCSSYEVLLESLSASRGSDSGNCMDDASRGDRQDGMAAPPSVERSPQPDVVHCFGVGTAFAFQSPGLIKSDDVPVVPSNWLSVDREPLVPPPVV